MRPTEPRWLHQLGESLLMLVVAALAARVVWELLAPALPFLIGLLTIGTVFTLLIGRR